MQKPGSPRAALLIDADNFHDPDQLQAVQAQFAQHVGKHFICHAHGGAQVLARETLKPVWQALAARLMPALPLPKNTTDTALVMDALLLHFQHGVTRFGIASGDADFAPLSLQLRELGCEVWCFARMAIAFEHMPSYYDKVVRFDRPPAPAPTPAAEPKKTPAPAPAATKATAPAPVPVAAPAPTKTTHGLSVAHVLQACPGLSTQEPQPMNTTVHTLRQKGLMDKTVKASAWFAQFGQAFKLVQQPGVTSTICWTPKAQGKPAVPALQPMPSAVSSQIKKPQGAPLAWPVTNPRHNARVLRSAELHALRKVLLQLAATKITVPEVLQAVPELGAGQVCALGSVASRLREHGLLHGSRSALDVLKAHSVFEVSLAGNPQTVRYCG